MSKITTWYRPGCSHSVPDFLAPCLVRTQAVAHFSSSQSHYGRRNGIPNRGISPLRRTGPGHLLAVHKVPLPKPVLSPALRTQVEVDEDHGLWGFFRDKKSLVGPSEDAAHGLSRGMLASNKKLTRIQVVPGQWLSYAQSRGKTCTSSGGCAQRIATGL